MKTIKISNAENNVLDVNVKELSQVVDAQGLEKIEVFTANGWQYLQTLIDDSDYNWDDEENEEVNVFRFAQKYIDLISAE